MQDVSQFFMDLLPAMAEAWIVAGIIVAGLLVTALVLCSVVIRGEDAGTDLDSRPEGPIARRVRKMVNLRVYSSDNSTYEVPSNDRDQSGPTDHYDERTQLTQPLAPQAPHLYYEATSRSRLF